MNAALLIMSSAALAGADPAPPPPPPAAPIVVNGGAGCTNCGAPAYSAGSCGDCCGSAKGGLLGHLKGRFGKKSHDCGCAPAPSCCAPAPAPCCDTCNTGCGRANLLDTLRARWGARKHGSSCCNPSPCCDPCAGGYGAPAIGPQPYPQGYYAPGAVVPPSTGTGNPPKEMPKPKDTPKTDTKPKEKGVSVPQPLPAAPVLTGNSPY